MLKNKVVIISSIIVTIIIVILSLTIFLNKSDKRNRLEEMKDSIENIIYYLPSMDKQDVGSISDYCKISLVFGEEYLKNDSYLSKEDYDTELKKNDGNSVKAYKKDNIINALKDILGNDVTINLEPNEEGEYPALEENGCGYNNENMSIISYNSEKEYIYSIDSDENNNVKIFVKWFDKQIDNDLIKLSAYALKTVKNEDGTYSVYADSSEDVIVKTIEADKDIEKEIEEIYAVYSNVYEITLKKNNKNYLWIDYNIVKTNQLYNEKMEVD